MKKVLATLVLAILGLFIATPAYAGGSDSPTPYTVDQTGITLPEGVTFPDGGHVNITSTSGGHGIHFESLNNQPSGQWIGKSFIPWSAFGLDAAECVSWVQISLYDEHFGEGQQPPVCLTPPVDPPTTPEECLVVLWKTVNLGDLWPQKIVTWRDSDCATFPVWETVCGSQYQTDIYADDEITAALIAGGVLNGPGNPTESWPGDNGYQSHFSQVWTTDPCIIVEPPVVDPPVVPPVVDPPVTTPPVVKPPVVPDPVKKEPVATTQVLVNTGVSDKKPLLPIVAAVLLFGLALTIGGSRPSGH